MKCASEVILCLVTRVFYTAFGHHAIVQKSKVGLVLSKGNHKNKS